jgi:transposase InsO family protein
LLVCCISGSHSFLGVLRGTGCRDDRGIDDLVFLGSRAAAQVKLLVKPKRRERYKRYSRETPGDRVQMDTMKIAPGVYQYTAVDDCSRFRVLGIYPRRTARTTLLFLDRVIEEMPFAIQRIQTDRGGEFFAEVVQRRLMQECIKFRPIPPRSPHLNCNSYDLI